MRRTVSMMMWTVAGLAIVLGAAAVVTAEVTVDGGQVPEATAEAATHSPQEAPPRQDASTEPVAVEPVGGSCTAGPGAQEPEPEERAGFQPCNCNTVADCNAICPGVPAACARGICATPEFLGRCIFAASCP